MPYLPNQKEVTMTMGTRIILTALLLSSVVLAQGAPQLSLVIDEEKVNLTDAERSGETTVSYAPGDTIRYTILASNVGDGVMRNPEILDPIPSGVVCIPASARGEDTVITFSIDGGENYEAWPIIYRTRNAQGRRVRVEATPDQITHVRWQFDADLAVGETREVEFKVEVR
jgi:uncharacterized repeat protein (TIGR01451 family)